LIDIAEVGITAETVRKVQARNSPAISLVGLLKRVRRAVGFEPLGRIADDDVIAGMVESSGSIGKWVESAHRPW
jgi:hypothetical protein